MKNNILFIFSILIFISCSNKKPQEVIKSYITAHNTHDIEKALTFYDENIVFELKDVKTKKGVE